MIQYQQKIQAGLSTKSNQFVPSTQALFLKTITSGVIMQTD